MIQVSGNKGRLSRLPPEILYLTLEFLKVSEMLNLTISLETNASANRRRILTQSKTLVVFDLQGEIQPAHNGGAKSVGHG